MSGGATAVCRICGKVLGFSTDGYPAGFGFYCSIRCYEGGRDSSAGTMSAIRDDSRVDRTPAREEALATAREVLAHATDSYVQAAADLSTYLLGLDAARVELVARLRGRAEACRRTHRAHLDAGRPDVAAQALARAEAYEVALQDAEGSLA